MRVVSIVLLVGGAVACASNTPLAPTSNGSIVANWRVTSIAGQAVPSGASVTLNAQSDGKLAGKSACNQYSAGYTANAAQLTVAPIISTRMACLEGGLMDVEQRYLDALQKVNRFDIDGDTLTLTTSDGRQVIAQRSSP